MLSSSHCRWHSIEPQCLEVAVPKFCRSLTSPCCMCPHEPGFAVGKKHPSFPRPSIHGRAPSCSARLLGVDLDGYRQRWVGVTTIPRTVGHGCCVGRSPAQGCAGTLVWGKTAGTHISQRSGMSSRNATLVLRVGVAFFLLGYQSSEASRSRSRTRGSGLWHHQCQQGLMRGTEPGL